MARGRRAHDLPLTPAGEGELELGCLRAPPRAMPSSTCAQGSRSTGHGGRLREAGAEGSRARRSGLPGSWRGSIRPAPNSCRRHLVRVPADTGRGAREASRGGAAGRNKRQQQRAQTSSSSWSTRPKIAGSICGCPRSASRRSTRACSSAVRTWASRLSASEQRASASSAHDPGLGSRAQRAAGSPASATVPGAPGSPGPRAPAAAALRARSATIPWRLANQ